jgi:hypothetical protein
MKPVERTIGDVHELVRTVEFNLILEQDALNKTRVKLCDTVNLV